MTATRLTFDAAAALAIVFASVMVIHRHPVKSVLALVVSFFALSIAYVLLSAPLIAAVQVIVYAGAILVLFLFVLMLLNVPEEARHGSGHPIHNALSAVAILVFAVALLSLLRSSGSTVAAGATAAGPVDIAAPARLLFSDHLLSFEALSVLLLAALVGAFTLARREPHR
ncbi:MAG TPA: NADH-quinone oxidoreductase subunit J [Thermoanaerobaculia bacterium]